MLSKKDIIELYSKIMTDYLLMIDRSDIIKKMTNVSAVAYNGSQIINHVFNLQITHDASQEALLYSCQKASFCYVEYIEQMHHTNLSNSLDVGTIASFIYKQSLATLSPTSIHNDHIHHLLNLIHRMFFILMAWDTNLSQSARIAICDTHLANYIKMFYNMLPLAYDYCKHMECVSKSYSMNDDTFFEFLNEYYSVIYKLKKKNELLPSSAIHEIILLHKTAEHAITNIRASVKELFMI